METKYFDSLYGGDSAKGVMLCMGITDGDFWARTAGAAVLYKGQTIDDADFERPEKVSDVDGEFEISGGQALSGNIYVVRRTNGCGNEEKTLNAAIYAEFDGLGNLAENECNKIINVAAEQIEGGKIRLRWFYHTIHQAEKISGFNIYSDNGSGAIDFQTPIGSVEYGGRKFYQFVTGSLAGSHYIFCIRAVENNKFNGQAKIWLNRQSPDGIGLIICQTV